MHTTSTVHGGNAANPYVLPQFTQTWMGFEVYQGGGEDYEMWVDEIAIDKDRIGCIYLAAFPACPPCPCPCPESLRKDIEDRAIHRHPGSAGNVRARARARARARRCNGAPDTMKSDVCNPPVVDRPASVERVEVLSGLKRSGENASMRRATPSLAHVLTFAVLAAAGWACTGTVGDAPSPVRACATCGAAGSTGAAGNGQAGGAQAGGPGGVGNPDSPNGVGWQTRYARLSNAQWEATVTDLFYLPAPLGFSSSVLPEPSDKGYVSEAAATLTVGGDAWARYETGAEAVAGVISADAAKLTKLAAASDPDPATALIKGLGRRAFRRALTSDEVAAYVALFKQGPALIGGDAFASGANLVIQTMLQSPHFLYRVERSATVNGLTVPLSGDEIATRLSYALWNTMPSDALFAAADAGELATADGVKKWAGKLLDDPRANDVLISFHTQTFSTADYGTHDHDASLGFDQKVLAPVLQESARLFFDDVVVQHGGGIRELLTTPAAYVSQQTAPFYDLPSGTPGLTRVPLDPQRRAGLLTQVGYLSYNSTLTTSDPVHRGLGVLRKVLCDEPDPPPKSFTPPSPQAGMTTRQIYETATSCGVGCHDTLINPPGFSFEHYDAVGKWRDTDNGLPVDSTGTVLVRDGWTSADAKKNPGTKLSFTDAVDLSKKLAETQRVHDCYARRLVEFALSRPVADVERGAGAALGVQSKKASSARELILSLVALDTFRFRVPDPTP
jgi:hypothetical protein